MFDPRLYATSPIRVGVEILSRKTYLQETRSRRVAQLEHNINVEHSHYPSGDRVESSGSGVDVPMEVAQAVALTRNHTLQWRSTMSVSFQRTERATRDALLAKSGISRIHSWLSRLRRTQLQAFAEMSTETCSTGFLCIKQFT